MSVRLCLDKYVERGRYSEKNIKAVAEYCDVDRDVISRMYNNQTKRPDLELIGKISDFFNCKPGDLIERE